MNNILINTINLIEIFHDNHIIDGKIYKVINNVNGKVYIGQTIKTIQQRFSNHCNKSCSGRSVLTKAIIKYGKENFEIFQIDSADNYPELNQKEYDWIIKEDCISPKGYNLRGGGMMSGVSEETSRKRSAKFRGRKCAYNKELDIIKFIYPDNPLPNGFEWGVNKEIYNNPERRKKISDANKDRIIVVDKHNQSRKKIKRCEFDPLIHKRFLQSTTKNTKAYHHPDTKRTIMVKDENPPVGFILGVGYEKPNILEETRQKLSESHKKLDHSYKYNNTNVKGRKYYHNPETKHVVMLRDSDIIPEGYIKGRGFSVPKDYVVTEETKKYISECIKNKIWVHHPDTKINRRVDKDKPIPDGFIIGRYKKPKDC